MAGFNVDRDTINMPVAPDATLRVEQHRALDELLDKIEREGGGGESITSFKCTEGHTHQLRLTLCDFTSQTICAFCDGTGVEGS